MEPFGLGRQTIFPDTQQMIRILAGCKATFLLSNHGNNGASKFPGGKPLATITNLFTNGATVRWSAARTEERPPAREQTAYQTPVNCSSTARRVTRFGLHGISFAHASGDTSRAFVFGALAIVKNQSSCRARTAPSRLRPAAPSPAPPLRRAVSGTAPRDIRVLGSTYLPDIPCMKKVYRTKKAIVHWSAARNEERVSSRGSTGRFVPPSVYIGFRLFVLPMPWRAQGTVSRDKIDTPSGG